jgi:hypothetical protein
VAKNVASPRGRGDRLELESMHASHRMFSVILDDPAQRCFFSSRGGPVPLQAPPGIRTMLITAWNKALTEEPRIDNAIDCTFVVSGTHDTQDLQTTTFGCVEVASAIISPRRNKRTHLSSGGGSIADSHDCN